MYSSVINYLSRIANRNEVAQEALESQNLTQEEHKQIKEGMKKQKIFKWVFTGAIIPAFYQLYRYNFFVGQSRFFLREIGLIVVGTFYFGFIDYTSNDLMWKHCGEVVMKHTNYSDQLYLDQISVDQMKEMYKNKMVMEYNSKRELEDDSSEQLYSDNDILQSQTNQKVQ